MGFIPAGKGQKIAQIIKGQNALISGNLGILDTLGIFPCHT